MLGTSSSSTVSPTPAKFASSPSSRSSLAAKVIPISVGEGFVLAVSSRQIVTGPNGMTVQSFSLSPSQETVLPAVTEERTTLPAAVVPERVEAPAAPSVPATVKQAEQAKAAENSYKAHGCAGYGD